MASYRPLSVYRHDGQTMHPKLAYALPPGMGAHMVGLGLFEKVDESADIDLSGLSWDSETVLAQDVRPDDLAQSHTG